MAYRVFSVGECPVCPGFGVVLALGKRTGPGLVFFCPACGVAWRSPPEHSRLDEVNRLEELAPDGVRLPEDAELDGLSQKATAVDSTPWESDLDELLDPSART